MPFRPIQQNTQQTSGFRPLGQFQPQGQTFEQKKPTSFLGKARDFATSIIGGGKLAQGLGQAIAAPGIQKDISKEQRETEALQQKLLTRIREKRTAGEDVSRLEKALKDSQRLSSSLSASQKNFGESLVSGKEIAGSALRLGTTLAGGALFGGVSKGGSFGLQAGKGLSRFGGVGNLFGARQATSFGAGALRGAGAGAVSGGIFGAAQGAGVGLEEEKDLGGVVKSSLTGGAIGAATGGAIGAVTGGLGGLFKGRKIRRQETKRILETKADATVAKSKLTPQGKVVKDPVAREAIKQGFDEGVVATVKNSSPTDKVKMNRMVNILEKGKRDPTFGAVNRPSDVIGDSVLERFKVVNTANKTSAKQLDIVAKNLKGQRADPIQAVNTFVEKLDDLGVKFKKGKPVYQGSQIEGLKEPQKIIDLVVKRMNNVSDDAFEIHNLKKFIDEQVSFGKSSGGLTGKTENILKGLRKGLDEVLDSNFTEYNKVNTTFATTKKVMDDFIRSAGARFDPSVANANARIGTLARRILSNTQSRTEVLNSMQALQDIAKVNGGKFSDDIIAQTVFVDDLERLFGTQARTSLAGEVSKGVQQARGLTGKLKSAQGLGDIALQLGAEGIEKARNINPEGLLKSIRALLK